METPALAPPPQPHPKARRGTSAGHPFSAISVQGLEEERRRKRSQGSTAHSSLHRALRASNQQGNNPLVLLFVWGSRVGDRLPVWGSGHGLQDLTA